MRITREQSQENRRKVIETADLLFREKGFEQVAVADLMRAAGMTHGGFYNHFESKAALEAAAVAHACARSAARASAVAAAPDRRAALTRFLDGYLSPAMRDAPAPRCAMLAYGADMPRHDAATRQAFADGLEVYLDNFAAALAPPDATPNRVQAISVFASMVGALVLARATADANPDLSDEILGSVRAGLKVEM
jgi:TetR/AcrR family transcriptional repressor of nem operon